jgi:very-short-patch-repair endonuclease
MLQKWALDTEQPESVLEAKMLSLCFTGSLPPFEFQARIGPYRVDFLWRDQKVIAECDGFAFPGSTRDQFESDRRRDNFLQALGYTVWRFSFRQILAEPQLIASQLRASFRRKFD